MAFGGSLLKYLYLLTFHYFWGVIQKFHWEGLYTKSKGSVCNKKYCELIGYSVLQKLHILIVIDSLRGSRMLQKVIILIYSDRIHYCVIYVCWCNLRAKFSIPHNLLDWIYMKILPKFHVFDAIMNFCGHYGCWCTFIVYFWSPLICLFSFQPSVVLTSLTKVTWLFTCLSNF